MSASIPIWVTDPTLLSERLASHPRHVGLDTEFIRERTFWPQLALVQLAIDGDILLLDPLAPGMLDALRPLLLDASVVKVMHSAGEDLVAFSHSCNAAPTPLFDTQTAAALTGIAAGIGYQRLVAELLGVDLPKGQTRSDWLKRPLSPAQLDYAADDVRYLGALYEQLSARLDALGRRDWFEEDCARQVEAAGSEPEPWPHLSARGAQHVDGPSRIRLLRLLRWREARARSHDRPRNWILDNELAFDLARRPPEDKARLQRRLDAHPKAPRKLADQIWAALETPLADEANAPQPPAIEADRNTVRQMQEAVSALSSSLGIPDGVLASRKRLEQLLETGRWPDALSGWRREQLEPVLAPLIRMQLPSSDPVV